MSAIQDDESKPGFVSTIILKFSQLGKTNEYKDENKVTCPRHPSFVTRMEQKNIKEVKEPSVKGTFQVNGEVSVKDRIKAYAQLTSAVGAAGWNNDTGTSSKSGACGLSRHESSYKLKPFCISTAKSSVASRFLESVNKKIEKKESFLQKRILSDTPSQKSVVLVKVSPQTSTDNIKDVPSLSTQIKTETPAIPQPEQVRKVSSSSICTSDSEPDHDLDRCQEYNFKTAEDDADDKIASVSPVSSNKETKSIISTDSSSSIDELLNEFENKEETDGEIIDPTRDSEYHPLPKGYIRDYSNNGFKLILPAATTKSILRKNGLPSRNRITFSTKPRMVMETYSVMEYDRGDDSIDPLTASAEWEIEKKTDALDKFTLEFEKDTRGLGLSIVGIGLGSESGSEKLGIYIKALTPGGAAEKTEKLREHDQILEVDGISLVGVTQSFAAQTLKSTQKNVKFLVGREKELE